MVLLLLLGIFCPNSMREVFSQIPTIGAGGSLLSTAGAGGAHLFGIETVGDFETVDIAGVSGLAFLLCVVLVGLQFATTPMRPN